MNKPIPLKRFGQNYLTDQNIIKKIISEINPKREDMIIEIGPGQGAITESLYKSGADFVAIEIDTRVIENLKLKFPDIKLLHCNFLELDLTKFTSNNSKKLRVVGNIPYNITSPILFKLMDINTLVSDAIFMVQYEVARRMIAKPGSKDYGILSVLLEYFGIAEFLFKVSPNVFYPKPSVHSAVIRIQFNDSRSDVQFNSLFRSIVKSSFGNRRKTLKNSLGNSIFDSIDFNKSGVDLSLRAEQLSLFEFIQLAEFASKQI